MTGIVITSTDGPGWRSSQTGSEPVAIPYNDQGAQEGRDGRDGQDGDQPGGRNVSTLISSWERRSAGEGGGEAGGLDVPLGGGLARSSVIYVESLM